MSHSSPGRPALPARVLRAAGSLAVLALLLSGVPWVLAAAGTLPAGIPSGTDITEALMSPDDGHVLFTVLTVLAWALWLWFALGVLAEIPHLLRRRPSRGQRRVLGTPQRLAGFLLGGLLVLPAGTAMASPVPAAAATAPLHLAHTVPHTKAPTAPATTAALRAETPVQRGPVHVVGETGETVWDLAVEYLGSGSRSAEIRRLNPGLPQGTLLPAGLHVQLPADAHIASPAPVSEQAGGSGEAGRRMRLAAAQRPAAAAKDEQGERIHTVEAGESLSAIAADELGDGDQWPQLFDASKGHDQPGHTPPLHDPDLIYPGQQITVPAAPGPTTPEAPGDKKEEPNPQDAGADGDKDTDREHGPGAGESGPTKPSATPEKPDREDQRPTHRPSPPSDASTPSGKPTSVPAPDTDPSTESEVFTLRTAGVLASLAAAVTLALSLRRILQRRSARPGELITMPQNTSPTEAQLAQAAEPTGILRLDRALRTLAHHAAQQGHALPALRGAQITDRSVQVLPDDLQAAAAPPFTAGRAGWWVCENTAELLAEDEAADVPPPYPGLVTIGADGDGQLVLLDLPHTGVLLLDGDRAHRTEVLTSLALELAMSPWASDVEVVVVGFGEGLNHLLPTGRIAHISATADAARDFAERLLEAHQEPEESRTPYLILCAADLDADSSWQLAETFHTSRTTMKVALIVPAGQARLLFEDSDLLDAADTQPQTLDSLGLDITLQRLERDALEEVTAALKVSGQEPRPADGAWQHVPSETRTAHAARTTASTHTGPPRTSATDPLGPAAGARSASSRRTADDGKGDGGLGIFPALLTASASPTTVPDLPAQEDPDGPDTPLAPAAEDDEQLAPTLPQAPPAPSQNSSSPSPEPAAGSPGLEGPPPGVPLIQVLGTVAISGVAASRHGAREAQLAALLHLRPGRTADALCTEMDPSHPWAAETLNSRLGGLRRTLGKDDTGMWYVPRRSVKGDPFTISAKICCDWHVFLRTVEAALPHGPAGLPDLERALHQVRGKPFGAQPLPWSEPLQQEIAMRIVSTAHTVATLRLESGPHHDLTLARRAIAIGLEVDDSAELLYRDWFQIEAAAGNRSGLIAAISRLDQVNRSLGLATELDTEVLMRKLLDQTDGQG
ncbi:LysM peptidoglycan-binding domain-containing protein [Streptomyces sp. NPDC058284]|uniref:LysM peptidoglycan-binding domain-containing protein n=1 Tax=unclassified Streptomyces TaxID=2593676 RepID=UPI0036582593